MKIEYRKADIADAELLIEIYNSAFYSDYIKYGECPAYQLGVHQEGISQERHCPGDLPLLAE